MQPFLGEFACVGILLDFCRRVLSVLLRRHYAGSKMPLNGFPAQKVPFDETFNCTVHQDPRCSGFIASSLVDGKWPPT
jgi:hypothetical protein